jgi:hypothetical protein
MDISSPVTSAKPASAFRVPFTYLCHAADYVTEARFLPAGVAHSRIGGRIFSPPPSSCTIAARAEPVHPRNVVGRDVDPVVAASYIR